MTGGRIAVTLAAVFAAGALSAACSSKPDVETVPIGTAVEITRQDGGVVKGTLTARDDQSLRVDVGRATRQIPRDQVAEVALVNAPKPAPLPAVAKFREYTIPAETRLAIRMETSLGSDTSRVGDAVEATLTSPITVDDVEIWPSGSVLKGLVTTAEPAGNVKGRASLGATFRSVVVPNGETFAITAGMSHTAAATKGSDAKKIGIPAAGGAILGAILGGKKGAVIGTTIGGGAGAIVVLSTSGPEVRYARGASLSLPLDQAVDVRVPIKR